MRILRTGVVLPAALILAGCGYVGDPLPPSLNIPKAVEDLTAVERGDVIAIEFTAPELTTDGVALRRFDSVDLRVGSAVEGDFDFGRWSAEARAIPVEAAEPGRVRVEIPAAGWAGKDVIIGVRVAGRRERFSEWSNLVRLRVVPPLEPPRSLAAEASPEGVRLSWNAGGREGLAFQVFRRDPGAAQFAPLARSADATFVDRAVEFGKSYAYRVQAFFSSGGAEAESALSAPIEITPVDRFPPAAPKGFGAITATRSIELNWDPNTEPDLAGYRLYRDSRPIGDFLQTPSYSDREVESGKTYRYAVAAVDRLGNESERSPEIEAKAP